MNTNAIANRRKYHRINFNEQVDLGFIDEKIEHFFTRNLSLSGMYISGDFQQLQIENCLITLAYPTESEIICFEATGRIVWKNDEGAGLRFTAMTFENYTSLLTLLVDAAEEPIILLNEFPQSCPFEISIM